MKGLDSDGYRPFEGAGRRAMRSMTAWSSVCRTNRFCRQPVVRASYSIIRVTSCIVLMACPCHQLTTCERQSKVRFRSSFRRPLRKHGGRTGPGPPLPTNEASRTTNATTPKNSPSGRRMSAFESAECAAESDEQNDIKFKLRWQK